MNEKEQKIKIKLTQLSSKAFLIKKKLNCNYKRN